MRTITPSMGRAIVGTLGVVVAALGVVVLRGCARAVHQVEATSTERPSAATPIETREPAPVSGSRPAGDGPLVTPLIRGRVVDRQGVPARHAIVTVSLHPLADREPTCVTVDTFEAKPALDADGSFTIEVPKHGKYVVAATAPRLAWASRDWVNPGDDVELVLERPSQLSGRVVDRSSGQPLSGPKVRIDGQGPPTLATREAVSGPDGAYSFEGLPPATFRLSVTLAGFVRSVHDLSVGAGTMLTHDVRLDPGVTVSGCVVEEATGRPISNVDVLAETQGHRTVTDAEGRFRLGGLPPGKETIDVGALGWSGASLEVTIRERPPLDGLVFRLSEREVVRGTVTDDDGVPIADATLSGLSGFQMQTFSIGRSDKQGRFAIMLDPDFVFLVWASKDGYSSDGMATEKMIAAGKPIDFHLAPADVTFAGRVVNHEGTPVAGALVDCRTLRRVTGTDERGIFVLERCPRNVQCWIRVLAQGYRQTDHDSVELKECREPVDLKIESLASPEVMVDGVVLDEDNAPVAAAAVILKKTEYTTIGTATSDSRGRFHLTAARPPDESTYELGTSSEWLVTGTHILDLRGPKTSAVLSVTRLGYLTGRVVDELTGIPLGGATLRLWFGSTNPRLGLSKPSLKTGTTSATGEFRFPVWPTTYSVIADAPGYRDSDPKVANLETGGTFDLGTLSVKAGARLEGTIRRPTGEGATVLVAVRAPDESALHEVARADGSGWYVAERVAAGPYDVFAIEVDAFTLDHPGMDLMPCRFLGRVEVRPRGATTFDAVLSSMATLEIHLGGEAPDTRAEVQVDPYVAGCPARVDRRDLVITSVDGSPLTACGAGPFSLSSSIVVRLNTRAPGEALSLELPATPSRLVMTLEGFETVDSLLALEPGKTRRVDLPLKRQRMPAPGK